MDEEQTEITLRTLVPTPQDPHTMPYASRVLMTLLRWTLSAAAQYGPRYPFLIGLSVDMVTPPLQPGILLTMSLSQVEPVPPRTPVLQGLDGQGVSDA